MTLDSDTPFPLKVHIVKYLTFCNLGGMSIFQEPVGQCAFPMVDMGYDTEIPDMLHIKSYSFKESETRYKNIDKI